MGAVDHGARWAVAVALAGSIGCGLSHEGGGSSGPGADGFAAPSLHIPMEPNSRVETWMQLSSPADPTVELPTVTGTAALSFAQGPDYPDTVEVEIIGVVFARCAKEGTVTIDSVTGGGEGVTTRKTSARSYRVTAEPGSPDRSIHVRGTFVSDEPLAVGGCAGWAGDDLREVAFDVTVDVRLRDVRGVDLQLHNPCHTAERAAYFAETKLGDLGYFPLDGAGRRFHPTNATSQRPVDITLTSRDGSELYMGPDRDIASVRLPSSATTVDIAAPVGPPAPVLVVDPRTVTAVEHYFELENLYGIGSTRLASGDVVDGATLERGGDRIFATLAAPQTMDGEPMCTSPPTALFELRSETPDVCRVSASGGEGDLHRNLDTQFGAATLLRDGECRLEWSAPELDGGSGLGGAIELTLANVDELGATD